MEKTKRSAIFAHFDNQNIIEDYVIFYLKELKKVADNIIFVSDCLLDEFECNKIKPFCSKIIAKPHGEYDFGSYKRGYQYLKQNNLLDDMDELILANDSCFGPFMPFGEVFDEMKTKGYDFWGISQNILKDPASTSLNEHVQSFFVVFKEQIFKNKIFDDFINKIKKEKDKDTIIRKYEIGLSKYLNEKKFKFSAYNNTETPPYIDQKYYWGKEKPVLVKKTAFLEIHPILIRKILRKINKNNYYPTDSIFRYYNNKYKYKKINLAKNIKLARRLIISIKLNKKTVELFGNTFKF